MTDQELFHLLALQKVAGIGDVIAKKLILHFKNAEAIFKATSKQLIEIEGIRSLIAKSLQDKTVFKSAEKELKFIEANQIQTLFFQDKAYPNRLKHCADAPILLFASGQLDFNNKKTLSIVGTRNITAYGADFCKNLIEDLAPLNPIIVSGFAYGVDIVAHQLAMDNNLQTVAILAHGLNQIYPKSHKKYMAKMEENGGFITEFWSSSNPDKENFVRRNRIVAGISEATIVIESAEKGGSLITANMANDYNRDVFAVPGRTTDKYSQGCNNLIKTQRANAVTSATDLIYMLNWDVKTSSKSIQKQLFVALEPDEQLVYDYLLKNGKALLDIIALHCNLPIQKIAVLLLNMELKGVVRPLPGKEFEAI